MGPDKCNIAEAYDKDFKIATMSMFKDLKEDMDKFCVNTNDWMQ